MNDGLWLLLFWGVFIVLFILWWPKRGEGEV